MDYCITKVILYVIKISMADLNALYLYIILYNLVRSKVFNQDLIFFIII